MVNTHEDTKTRDKVILTKSQRNNITCYLFLLPIILGFLIFVFYPILASLFFSFTDFNGVSFTKIGLFNYTDIFDFSRMGLFREILKSFGLTFGYALTSIPLNLVLSYALALVLHKQLKGIKVIRLLCYLPVLIPSIAFGQIWMEMLGFPDGLLNQWMSAIGLAPNTFFVGKSTQLTTLLITSQWGIGGGMIMWLAALNNIPTSLYESAKLDGAGYFSCLFRITIPMSTPIIFYNLICSIISCLQTFDTYAYLGRGIDDATYFIAIRVYVTAFVERDFGAACGIAWLLFAVIGILTLVMFKTSKWVFYGDENS